MFDYPTYHIRFHEDLYSPGKKFSEKVNLILEKINSHKARRV